MIMLQRQQIKASLSLVAGYKVTIANVPQLSTNTKTENGRKLETCSKVLVILVLLRLPLDLSRWWLVGIHQVMWNYGILNLSKVTKKVYTCIDMNFLACFLLILDFAARIENSKVLINCKNRENDY